MASIQLYKGLVNATEAIVTKFGKDVLTEDRFVNILADMYPDRDNPAMFSIIRTLVKEGYCSDLLLCNKDCVQSFISKSTVVLNQKKGYDKNLVESILNSLAVGCKITIMPPSVVPTPKKQKKQVKNKPQSPNQKPVKTPSSHRLLIIFYWALSFFGLFIAPVVYLLAITGLWWPSFTLFLILAIQAVIFTVSYNKLLKHKPLPFVGGSFSAIILCAVIFFAFVPFYAGSDSVKDVICYLGITYNYDMFFPMITLMISFLYFGFVNCGGKIAGYDLTLIFDHLMSQFPTGKVGINKLLKNMQFMKGFILSGLFILMVGLLVMYWPTIDSWKNSINNSLLRNGRSNVNKELSFADFRIGSDFDSCVYLAKSLPSYSYNNMYFSKDSLKLNNDFNIKLDSSITIRTKWYNDSVFLNLHSSEGK